MSRGRVWFCLECGRCGSISDRRRRALLKSLEILATEDHDELNAFGCNARPEVVVEIARVRESVLDAVDDALAYEGRR